MERISVKNLEAVCARINRTVNGREMAPWTLDEAGNYRATIGAYTLDGAYGGYSLHRIVNEGGGVTDVFGIGHVPKRELYHAMHAFLRGLEACEEISA